MIHARAYGKVNIFLGVGARRADGYHDLQTIFQSVDLHDDLYLQPATRMSLTVTGLGARHVPTDPSNLVWKAHQAFAAHVSVPDFEVHLHKAIPTAGGMAGGSADAAAMLRALNHYAAHALSEDELMSLAAGLGADVPFCLFGGTALGAGRGDQLQRILSRPLHWVFALSPAQLSTPEVFATFDRLATGTTTLPNALLTALARGDVHEIGERMANDLQPAALQLQPSLRKAWQTSAVSTMVSGSGPTVALLCEDAAHAHLVADELAEENINAVVAASQGRGAHVVQNEGNE